MRRSSSSRRGRARAVSYKDLIRHDRNAIWVWRCTSSPLSNLAPNSATTMLICSFTGTYALPLFNKTLRPSTSSGTLSKSTLNHPPSSISCLRSPGVAASRSGPNSLFSSSETLSQSKFKESTNSCRSLASSSWKRSLNNALSMRANRRRRSSVEENARRRMKCE